MATITVVVDDDVANEFRQVVVEERGGKKGDLGKAVTEAMQQWSGEKMQKKIAAQEMERMRRGLYTLPKGWKFNREEAHER